MNSTVAPSESLTYIGVGAPLYKSAVQEYGVDPATIPGEYWSTLDGTNTFPERQRRFHVLCEGRQRFRIRATLPDAPYPRADVDFLPAPSDAASDEAQDLAAQVRDLFTTHLRLTLAIEGGWQRAFRLPDRPDALADHVAGQVDAVVAVKQQILQTPAAVERLRMVRHMLAVENAALTERLAGRRQLSLGGLGVLN